MVLQFPSGRVTVSVQELLENRQSQSTCGICDKPWIIKSDGCIMNHVHVLHPCQHLVGSGCWVSVPAELKDKCPVCKVEIRCDEQVQVVRAFVNYDQVCQNSDAQTTSPVIHKMSAWKVGQAQKTIIENKKKEGINTADMMRIMYFMNLRARLDAVRGSLGTLLASTKAMTPMHREKLIHFLAYTPQSDQHDGYRKIQVALQAFNISGETEFTMDDLRKTLSSAEHWVKKHFAAILENKDTSATAIQRLERRLANVETELKELKDRQSRESALQLETEIALAVADIEKKAEEDVVKIRTKAEEKVSKEYAYAEKRAVERRTNVEEKIKEEYGDAKKRAVELDAKAEENIEKVRATAKEEIAITGIRALLG